MERLIREKESNEDLIKIIQGRIKDLEDKIAILEDEMIDMRNEHSKLMNGL